jgi:hypothetical protein
LDGKLFGMRGYPVAAPEDRVANPLRVPRVLIFLPKGQGNRSFEVARIVASGSITPPTASTGDADPYFPLVDTFGQYRHRDWPGKTKSIEEMTLRGRAEEAELAQDVGPKDWSRFGGWTSGPKLEATGCFRTVPLWSLRRTSPRR